MRVSSRDAGHVKTHMHAHGAHDASGSTSDDDFFCKGIQVGHTHIEVKILEKGYEKVAAALIHITVVQPFMIQPALQKADEMAALPRILPTSEFSYDLFKMMMDQDV